MLFRELFQRFGIIWKLFGAFLTNFENSTEFLCYFLCYFLKNSEFGRTPEFREQGTALDWGSEGNQISELSSGQAQKEVRFPS